LTDLGFPQDVLGRQRDQPAQIRAGDRGVIRRGVTEAAYGDCVRGHVQVAPILRARWIEKATPTAHGRCEAIVDV